MTRERFIEVCVEHGASPEMAEYAVDINLPILNRWPEPEQETVLVRILPLVMRDVSAAMAPWN